MTGLVYILCAATSLGSALLLCRGALARGGGLLFWSAICFFAMGVNNVLLYLNLMLPDIDLLMPARLLTAAGIILLNIGLIWHST